MKKFLITLLFFVSNMFFDGTVNSVPETLNDNPYADLMETKIKNLEEEMRLKFLIKTIEFDSEVIIPNHISPENVAYIYNLANQLNIPIRTAFRLVYKESNFKDDAVSRVGAIGLMQLMPETRVMYYSQLCADTLKLDKVQEDIYIGLNLLNELYHFWKARNNSEQYSWKLALASYNAGKGSVIQYKGIPPFKETQNFVSFILKPHSNPSFAQSINRKYSGEFDKPIS